MYSGGELVKYTNLYVVLPTTSHGVYGLAKQIYRKTEPSHTCTVKHNCILCCCTRLHEPSFGVYVVT